MRHRANLDFLRSYAATTVIIDHLVSTLRAHAGFHNAATLAFTAQIGHSGVIAFFVHTSLVLMYSLERIRDKVKHFTSHFYIRRAFRIYPLALFSIALALLFHIPAYTTSRAVPPVTHRMILANVLLVQNFVTKNSILGPLWSLPYEVQMYLVLPALFLLARKTRGALAVVGLIIIFCAVGVLVDYKSGHLNLFAYIPCFLAGVLCYALRDKIHQTIPAIWWTPFLFAIISIFCLANMGRGRSWLTEPPTFWSAWLFSLILGLAINAFRDSTWRPGNIAAEKVALYSYGLYLLHVPALYLVFMVWHMQNLWLGIPIFLAITALASVITYHLIEEPLIEVGRKLSMRPRLIG